MRIPFFRRAARRRVGRKKLSFRTLAVESMEERLLLSVSINWHNRGVTSGSPFIVPAPMDVDLEPDDADTPDNFNFVFGSQAEAARNVVDAALQAWENVIASFNDPANTGDNFLLTVTVDTEKSGCGGSARTPGTADPFNGIPDEGTIIINSCNSGWFVDNTPSESSEFRGQIINAFAGNATTDGPADGLFDLYTLVVLEMTHVLGLGGDEDFLFEDLFDNDPPFFDSGQPDVAVPGTLWVYDQGGVRALFTDDNGCSGGTDTNEPIHTAEPAVGNSITHNGTTYYGAHDSDNACFEGSRRYLPSLLNARVMAEVYGYSINQPQRFGTFYANLNETTGELLLRGGTFGQSIYFDTAPSNDSFTLSQDGSNLRVDIDIGVDVPGTGLDDPGAPQVLTSFFPLNKIQTITIQPGDSDFATDGDETIVLDLSAGNWIPNGGLPGISMNINGGTGKNLLQIKGSPGTGDAYTVTNGQITIGSDTINYSNITEMMISAEPTSSNNAMVVSGTDGVLQKLVLVGSDGPNGNDGQDTITIFDTGDTLLDLDIQGMGGPDQIAVQQLGANAVLTIDAGGEDDLVILGASVGKMDGFRAGPVHTILGGAGLGDQLFMQDSNNTSPAIYNFDTASPTGPASVVRVVGGAQFFEHDDVEEVVLNAGSDNDSLFIAGTSVGSDLTIFGSDGDEDFFVGTSGPGASVVQNIRSHVTIHGGSGANSAVVDDTGDNNGNIVTITETTIGAGTQPTDTFFGFEGKLEYHDLTDGTSLADLIIKTGGGSDTIDVESTAEGTDTTIFAQRGDDNITVTAPQDTSGGGSGGGPPDERRNGTADGIKSLLVIHGDIGVDFLTVIDNADTTADIMTLTDTTIGMPATDTFLGTASAGIVYTSISTLSVLMGSGGNQAFVESTHFETENVFIDTGDGNDTLLVRNPTGTANDIHSRLNFDGQDGIDVATIDDSTETALSTLTVTPDQVLGDGTFFGAGGELTYARWEDLIVNAGLAGDTVTVTGTNPVNTLSAGTVTTLNTGGGIDLVTVGLNGTVDFVRSPLVIDGGPFPGAVVALLDPLDLTPDEFTVTDKHVGAGPGDQFFGPFGSFQYANLKQLNLEAGLGNNVINFQSTNPGTKYLFGGGGGDDVFQIDSNGAAVGGTVDLISSPLDLFGGIGNDSVVLGDSDDPTGDVVSIVPTGLQAGKIGQGPTDNFFGVGGSIDYDQMAVVGMRTSDRADTVFVAPAPSTGTLIAVVGSDPTAAEPMPHDTLIFDLSGVGMPKLSLIDFDGGELSSPTHASIFYSGMEIIDEASGGNRYDLVVDTIAGVLPGNDGVDDEVLATSGEVLGRKTLNLRINGTPAFAGYETAINSLTVIGSTDQDTLSIVETDDGLPRFPGVAIGSHTNTVFLAEVAAGRTPSNVGIHFDGGTGPAIDRLDGILTSDQDVAIFNDSVGAPKSGVVNIDGMFTMSFVNLEPITLQAAGGSLLVNATRLRDMTNMALLSFSGGGHEIRGDGSFETTIFSGFDVFSIEPPERVTLLAARHGDTDFDGDIDSDDIQIILAANSFGNPGRGPGPGGQWSWEHGDYDNDGLVGSADIQLILSTNLFGEGPYTDIGSPATVAPIAFSAPGVSVAIVGDGMPRHSLAAAPVELSAPGVNASRDNDVFVKGDVVLKHNLRVAEPARWWSLRRRGAEVDRVLADRRGERMDDLVHESLTDERRPSDRIWDMALLAAIDGDIGEREFLP